MALYIPSNKTKQEKTVPELLADLSNADGEAFKKLVLSSLGIESTTNPDPVEFGSGNGLFTVNVGLNEKRIVEVLPPDSNRVKYTVKNAGEGLAVIGDAGLVYGHGVELVPGESVVVDRAPGAVLYGLGAGRLSVIVESLMPSPLFDFDYYEYLTDEAGERLQTESGLDLEVVDHEWNYLFTEGYADILETESGLKLEVN